MMIQIPMVSLVTDMIISSSIAYIQQVIRIVYILLDLNWGGTSGTNKLIEIYFMLFVLFLLFHDV